MYAHLPMNFSIGAIGWDTAGTDLRVNYLSYTNESGFCDFAMDEYEHCSETNATMSIVDPMMEYSYSSSSSGASYYSTSMYESSGTSPYSTSQIETGYSYATTTTSTSTTTGQSAPV
eukprot:1274530-Rhodomonas_salina.1